MAIDVFLSVGGTSTPQQEKFVSAIEEYMRVNGLAPRAVGRTDFSSLQPLKHIEQLMKECSGTVIIAFERIHIRDGVERRGSDSEKAIKSENLPTVWNQVEGAMADVLGHPLLVIVEHGLRSEGLLETRYDWYVQWVNLDPATFSEREFVGIFADWKKRVEQYHASGKEPPSRGDKPPDIEKMTIGELVAALKPSHLWAVVSAVVGLMTAVAVTAYALGTLFAGGP